MKALHVDAIAPQAAIYLTIKMDLVREKTEENENYSKHKLMSQLIYLNEAKLAVVPFYAFGAAKNSPWYRLSVGTCKKEEIPEMFVQLKKAS